MEQTKYDVFISYSRRDYVDTSQNVIPNNHVNRIMQALNDAGITYWIDKKGIYSGDEFAGIIADAIDASSVFVFVSSESSNNSPWTIGEIATAQEAKKKIIPVRIDYSRYHKSLRVRLNALDYIDFTINPQKGCSELIRSIKAFQDEEKANIARIQMLEMQQKEEQEKIAKQKEEEKLRKREIQILEDEISVIESQRTDFKKVVVKKEQELKIAQMDLEECERRLHKKQTLLSKLQDGELHDDGSSSESVKDINSQKSERRKATLSNAPTSKKKKEIKYEREFSDIVFRSKKIPYVFERDTISKSINITHFIEILENEYGININAEEINSCKTIGKLKEYVLNLK